MNGIQFEKEVIKLPLFTAELSVSVENPMGSTKNYKVII